MGLPTLMYLQAKTAIFLLFKPPPPWIKPNTDSLGVEFTQVYVFCYRLRDLQVPRHKKAKLGTGRDSISGIVKFRIAFSVAEFWHVGISWKDISMEGLDRTCNVDQTSFMTIFFCGPLHAKSNGQKCLFSLKLHPRVKRKLPPTQSLFTAHFPHSGENKLFQQFTVKVKAQRPEIITVSSDRPEASFLFSTKCRV